MGTSQYISLKDAALMTERSQQTIRRLIKANKVKYRKYKTPQGFTYLVEKSSLIHHFQEADELDEAELVEEFDMDGSDEEVTMPMPTPSHGPAYGYTPPPHQPYGGPSMGHWPTMPQGHVMPPQAAPPPPPPAPVEPMHLPMAAAAPAANSNTVIQELIRQHRDDKSRLFELLETFQKRILILEDHIRLLEAPKSSTPKPWYQFWKR